MAVILLAVAVPALAQDRRVPAPSSEGKGAAAPVFASVTIFGCLERESDYRAANGLGHGGLVGTGIGTKNEYVLAEANAGRSVGTSGEGSAYAEEQTYQLTGHAEGDASAYIGTRVEVSGYFDPAGKDTDLGLRRFHALLIRPIAGDCR